MTEGQKQKLEQQLWNIANELRGKMSADEFRDYILGFIFFKYLSERQHLFANKLLETENVKDYALLKDEADIEAIKEESLEKLGYFLRPDELFKAITAKGNADKKGESNFILEDLQGILNSIEQSTMGTESEDDFNKLFEDLDLGNTKLGRSVEARNTLISKVLSHLDKIDFDLETADSDILGDAYEYLIAQFASGAGKKAGEFYTPQQVSKVLARIVTLGKKRIKNAYDPACGSGSLLLRIGKEAEVGEFCGQELNRTTYNLCRMNMILHGVHFSRFDIKQEDTLEDPQHLEERFEAVVANPPFSAKWKGAENPLNETDDRFSQYGRLAPNTKADYAFIQHMIFQMADNGVGAIVVPHGVLYRGGAEAAIREYIIKEQNYLDAVIGLPANIFYGTTIPACILVLKKCRVHDGDILFIDCSKEYKKAGNKNSLTNDHVSAIVNAYEKRKNIENFSYIASLNEIELNHYNLNISRYIENFPKGENYDIKSTVEKNNRLFNCMSAYEAQISEGCDKLGIEYPIGYSLPTLKAFKTAALEQIFNHKISFSKPDGSKYKEWKIHKFGGLFKWIRTNSLSRDNLTMEKSEVQNIHYGDIHTKYLSNFHQSNEEVPYIKDSKMSDFRPEEFCVVGDVVIADASEDYNDIGKAIEIVGVTETPLVAGLHTYIARQKTKKIALGFAGYLLRSKEARRQIMRVAQGVSVLGLPKPYLEEIDLELPEIEEQKQIATFLSALDAKIALIERDID